MLQGGPEDARSDAAWLIRPPLCGPRTVPPTCTLVMICRSGRADVSKECSVLLAGRQLSGRVSLSCPAARWARWLARLLGSNREDHSDGDAELLGSR